MSTTLLSFNPEAYGSGGDKLLFGVSVPMRPRSPGLSPLEQLNLASLFLEARPGADLTILLKHIVHRIGASRGKPLGPAIAESMLRRLTQTAAMVRGALASGDIGTGSPRSPEAIFGAELEGLSPEDQEFETARQFVRFAEEMARVAVDTAPDAAPGIVTSRAEQLAAHRLAPGLPRAIASPPLDFRARRRARLGR
jgi:hypothetical protein